MAAFGGSERERGSDNVFKGHYCEPKTPAVEGGSDPWVRIIGLMPSADQHNRDRAYSCSLCGRFDDQVRHLITAPGNLYICDGCVGICNAILARRRNQADRRPRRIRRRPAKVQSREQSVPAPGSAAAVERVREQYEDIVHLGKLRLEQINRVRHPAEYYCSIQEYVRELWARAGAVSTFAVNVGLVSPDQALQIIQDFLDEHPDIPREGPPNAP